MFNPFKQLSYFLASSTLLLTISVSGCVFFESSEPRPLAVGDTVTISVLTSTDLHGWILPWDYSTDSADERFGIAKVATLVDSIRAVQPHTILIDAGDWLQGNQLAAYYANSDTLTPYYPLLKAAEFMEYDAFVLGNHEFNFGIDYLNKRLSQTTSIHYLAANVYDYGTTNPAYKPFHIKEVAGVKVGIVGLTTPGSMVWDRPRVEGRLDFGDGVEAGRRFVAEARAAGAEIIVVLAHCGLESGSSYTDPNVADENFGRALLESVSGIDLFVFGHSHRVTEDTFVPNPDSLMVPIIQAGRWASHLGEAKLSLTRLKDHTVQVVQAQTKAFSVETVKASEKMTHLMQPYHDATRTYVNEALVTTTDSWDASDARLKDNPVVDLIHEVQFHVTDAQLSAASAFNTNARFGPGTISRKDMAAIYPYENMLYVIEITGKQLKEYLEQSSRFYTGIEQGEPVINRSIPGYNFDTIAGVDYIIDLSRPIGRRVTSLTFGGIAVTDNQKFTMAVNSYRGEGGGGYTMLAGSPIVWKSEVTVRAMLEEYLANTAELSHSDVFKQNWRFIW
jgi:2',3'-cyclic-nucleotide 2'-phosphodiesterase (5'-nucleotidase family)